MSGTHNTSSGDNHGTVIQIGSTGSTHVGQAEPQAVRIVPKSASRFQNRDAELARLDTFHEQSQAEDGSRLCCVEGPPGIGKTATVIRWINRNRHRFKHAQIVMACGGDLGEGHGRGIEEVCDQYFHATGVDTDAPGFGTLADKLAQFRRRVESQPVVLLLDDVRSAAQVEPFLSDLPGMVVITTSRERVRGLGLHKPFRLEIGALANESVVALFHDIVGKERFTGDTGGAFADLVRLCGGLPLIAGHTAALLADEDGLSVAELVARMAEAGRLTHLEAAAESTARPSAVFDVFYQELREDAARLYRALGRHPTRAFDRWLVRSLFVPDPERGESALAELVTRSLVKGELGGRYSMDDLTHEHAGLVADRRDDGTERRELSRRIADYYLHGAVAADTVRTQRWRLGPLYGEESPYPLPDFAAAHDRAVRGVPEEPDLDTWLEYRRGLSGRGAVAEDFGAEWEPTPDEWLAANLEAVIACMERAGRGGPGGGCPGPGYGWQTGEATNGFFAAQGRNDERATLLTLALADAEACADTDAVARMRAQWCEAKLGQGLLNEAEEYALSSLEAAEAEGADPRGRGAALEWLGVIARRRGEADTADARLDESLPFLDRTRKRPLALHHMHKGDTALVRGDTDAALGHYRTSRSLFREHAESAGKRDYANEGKLLVNEARILTPDHAERARALLEEALARFLAADRAYQVGKVLESLADLTTGGGATEYRLTAVEVFGSVGAFGAADRVRARLADHSP